ncbi:hypothetical protein [Achromobacter dolens]|uniref:hypothetical protein n=1 Tax=Achromobacter dolens TaxID=1287738 RepID=UPI0031CF97AC
MHKGYQVLLLLFFLGFCSVLATHWPTSSGEWASWVQALGSIAAIGVAIWIPYDQAVKRSDEAVEEKRERREEFCNRQIAKLESSAQLVESLGQDILTVCRAALESEKPGDITNRRRARFLSRSLDAVQRIDLHDMPYAVISRPTVQIMHLARSTVELLQYLHNPIEADNIAAPMTVEERLGKIRKAVEVQLGSIDVAVRTFDGVTPSISVRHL